MLPKYTTAALLGAIISTVCGVVLTMFAENLSVFAAIDALWRCALYLVIPVAAMTTLLMLSARAADELRTRSVRATSVGYLFVLGGFAALLFAASVAIGVDGFELFAIVGASLLLVGLSRLAPGLSALDRPEGWILGILVGGAVTWWVERKFELWHSVGPIPMDPNAILLAASVGLTVGAGFAFAGALERKEDKFRTLRAAICALVAVALAWGNRFVVVPRLYLEAHLAIAAFEWFLWVGALSWAGVELSRKWLTRIGGGLAMIIVVAVATNGGDGARPLHIDYSARMFGLALSPADLDGDGFLPKALGGSDCDEGAFERQPFAREKGKDENCNGILTLDPSWALGGDQPTLVPDLPDADLMVIVTIDTLRPDYMQVYGAENETTPNLAAVTDWARFDRAYTSGGITTLAVNSLLNGRVPLAIDLTPVYRSVDRRYLFFDERTDERVNRVFHVPRAPKTPSVAELVTDSGHATYAFVDDGASRVFQKGLGYERGFGAFTYPNAPEGPGEENWDRTSVTDAFLEALPTLPRGAFVWMHYYDPHNAQGPCRKFGRTGGIGCYEDAIWDIDAELGRVFEGLKAADRWDNTFVAISSDHGEALGEHGLTHHGLDSFEEFVHIPLLARGPGFEPGTVTTPVSLIDISRTVSNYAGTVGPTLQGHDLRLTQRGVARRLPVLSQLLITSVDGIPYRQQTLLVDGESRQMWDRITQRAWSTTLPKDPEQRNLQFGDAATVKRWIDIFERHGAEMRPTILAPAP